MWLLSKIDRPHSSCRVGSDLLSGATMASRWLELPRICTGCRCAAIPCHKCVLWKFWVVVLISCEYSAHAPYVWLDSSKQRTCSVMLLIPRYRTLAGCTWWSTLQLWKTFNVNVLLILNRPPRHVFIYLFLALVLFLLWGFFFHPMEHTQEFHSSSVIKH